MSRLDTVETGPSGPSEELVRWEARYRQRETEAPAGRSDGPEPPRPLARMASLLPNHGRAIDLAGGDGGGGLFLARRGLDAMVLDISPVALQRAAAFARGAGLELGTVAVDLAGSRLSSALDASGWPDPAVITCCHYLNRSLLASVAEDLPHGARFVVAIATTSDLGPDDRRSTRFLLEPGELADLVLGPTSERTSGRLRVLHRREGWAWGHHRAELVVEAVRPRTEPAR